MPQENLDRVSSHWNLLHSNGCIGLTIERERCGDQPLPSVVQWPGWGFLQDHMQHPRGDKGIWQQMGWITICQSICGQNKRAFEHKLLFFGALKWEEINPSYLH